MSEITGKGLLTDGVDEACELLRKLIETPGLYSLEFKFIYHGYDVAPAIEYQVYKYAGYPERNMSCDEK